MLLNGREKKIVSALARIASHIRVFRRRVQLYCILPRNTATRTPHRYRNRHNFRFDNI